MCGKISLDDLIKPNIAKKLEKDKIKLPPFIENMDEYMAALDIVARTNHIYEKGASVTPDIISPAVTQEKANNDNADELD